MFNTHFSAINNYSNITTSNLQLPHQTNTTVIPAEGTAVTCQWIFHQGNAVHKL